MRLGDTHKKAGLVAGGGLALLLLLAGGGRRGRVSAKNVKVDTSASTVERVKRQLARVRATVERVHGETARRWGGVRVPVPFVLTIMHIESRGFPDAEPRDRDGNLIKDGDGEWARGLMQLKQSAQQDMGLEGEDIFDPDVNILGGVRYLATLMKKLDGRAIPGYTALQTLGIAYHDGRGKVHDPSKKTDYMRGKPVSKKGQTYAAKIEKLLPLYAKDPEVARP